MERLRMLAEKEGLSLNAKQLAQFTQYQKLLIAWNRTHNLTAITQPEEILEKHFIDSLLLMKHWPLPKGVAMIDVGTGAGFPSIPLKIVRPDIQLTLLDGRNKKISFLKELTEQLEQNNQVIHGRAEDLAHQPEHREQYSLAVARAVAALPVLLELCLPFVQRNGMFLAMKGPSCLEEVENGKSALEKLGGTLLGVGKDELPSGDQRTIIKIQKISQTPTIFPRRPDKIAKTPI